MSSLRLALSRLKSCWSTFRNHERRIGVNYNAPRVSGAYLLRYAPQKAIELSPANFRLAPLSWSGQFSLASASFQMIERTPCTF
jgi:hypothetical protein